MLDEGDVHLALASSNEFTRDTEFCKFTSDPVVLAVPHNHPWASRTAVTPTDLLEADFIMREEGSGTKVVLAEALSQHGIGVDELRTVLMLGNSEAIALAVQEGIGVGFLSQIVVSRIVQDRVVVVPVIGLEMHQDIFIGRHTGYPATTAQNAFWEFMTDPTNPVRAGFETASAAGDWTEFPEWDAVETEQAPG